MHLLTRIYLSDYCLLIINDWIRSSMTKMAATDKYCQFGAGLLILGFLSNIKIL